MRGATASSLPVYRYTYWHPTKMKYVL